MLFYIFVIMQIWYGIRFVGNCIYNVDNKWIKILCRVLDLFIYLLIEFRNMLIFCEILMLRIFEINVIDENCNRFLYVFD